MSVGLKKYGHIASLLNPDKTNQFVNLYQCRYNVYVAVNDSPPMKLDDISYIGTGAVYAVVLRPFAPLTQREEVIDYTLRWDR